MIKPKVGKYILPESLVFSCAKIFFLVPLLFCSSEKSIAIHFLKFKFFYIRVYTYIIYISTEKPSVHLHFPCPIDNSVVSACIDSGLIALVSSFMKFMFISS